MSEAKLKYNRNEGRMEIWADGGQAPRLTLTDEGFADLLAQIFEFVEDNSPHIRIASEKRWKRRYSQSVRFEAWQWLRGAVKEKIAGYFKKK